MIRPGVRRLFRLPLRGRRHVERELDDEIRMHLELRVEQLVRRGYSAEAARAEALRRFGSLREARRELVQAVRERETRLHMREWWDDLRQDTSFAWRTIASNPGFTAAVVLTLALGIGASSAMFTVVNAVLLRPPAFVSPERLAVLTEVLPNGETHESVSPANYADWREQSRSFSELTAWTDQDLVITGGGEPEEVRTRLTMGNYFTLLGVKPLLGRVYQPGEELEDVVVQGHRFWQQRFGGDAAIVGRTVSLNDQPVTVLGVLAPDAPSVGEKPLLYAPTDLNPEWRGRFLRVAGRLKPGVTLEEARAEMAALGRRLSDAYPQFNKDWSIRVFTLSEATAGEVRPALLVLLGAVGFLLLIACANVANLLLGRAAARRREVAVRRALGASRGRLIRQLLTESVVLAFIAGALGLLLAAAATRLLVLHIPSQLAMPRVDEITVDLRVVAFTAAAALITGVLFGVAPALIASGAGPAEAMRESSRGNTAGRARGRLRASLIVAEVALALVLLAGAGLLARSFEQLMRVDPGLDPEHVLTLRVAARSERYREPGAQRRLADELVARLKQQQGVQAAGIIGPWLPLSGNKGGMSFQRDDRPPSPVGQEPGADIRLATGEYYRVMKMPLLAGRTFDARDTGNSPDAVIVNEALAKRYFPGEDPVGKRIAFEWYDTLRAEIVGVVGSVREMSPAEEASPAIYIPFAKRPDDVFHVVIRTTGDPNALADEVRAVVHRIDPNQPVANLRAMVDVVGDAVARPRLNLVLLGAFAALAITLAGIGLYGVIAYSVAQRSAEIGVRMALGANRGVVQRMIVGEGMRLALLGVTVGVPAALLLTRLMSSLLFGVKPGDPFTLAAVAVFLCTVALLASWIPARRAARTDPAAPLRLS